MSDEPEDFDPEHVSLREALSDAARLVYELGGVPPSAMTELFYIHSFNVLEDHLRTLLRALGVTPRFHSGAEIEAAAARFEGLEDAWGPSVPLHEVMYGAALLNNAVDRLPPGVEESGRVADLRIALRIFLTALGLDPDDDAAASRLAQEREADKSITRGEVTTYDSVDEFIAGMEALDADAPRRIAELADAAAAPRRWIRREELAGRLRRHQADPGLRDSLVSLDEPIRDVARRLVANLGAFDVAELAGVTDRRLPEHWGEDDGQFPGALEEARLRAAFIAWVMLVDAIGARLARIWFRTFHPALDGQAPIYAIASGMLDDVVAAARQRIADEPTT